MLRLVLRRLWQGALVIVGVLTMVFFVTRAIGDPARLSLPLTATQDMVDARRDAMGLNDPILVQYVRFMKDALRGDFGDSMWQQTDALQLALDHLPATLYLTATTLVLAVPAAILTGTLAATRRGTWVERSTTGISTLSVSMVEFWVALMLIFFFSVRLGWLPTSGYGGLKYVILPAVTLALRPFGRLSEVTRSSMSDQLEMQYMRTAAAKGMRPRRRLFHHAFRNALIPVLTLTAAETVGLISGAVVIETIFGWPGVGQLLMQAITRRDLELVSATVFILAVLIVVINIAVDLAYAWIDPRIREQTL